MIGWSIELSEFGIDFQKRGPIKFQAIADFIAELIVEASEVEKTRTI